MKNISAAVFVKTPNVTPLKTRLAKTIGTDLALEFFRLSVNAVDQTLKDSAKAVNYSIKRTWSIAEHEMVGVSPWNTGQFIWQGNGGLGNRLHLTYSQLLKNSDAVILMGGDCPQLSVNLIQECCEYLLKTKGFIIGKSEDGGFWVFGGNVSIPQDLWNKVSYSTSTTTKELVESIQPLGPIQYTSTLVDVDEFEDLPKALHQLENLKTPNEYQRELIKWIRQTLQKADYL